MPNLKTYGLNFLLIYYSSRVYNFFSNVITDVLWQHQGFGNGGPAGALLIKVVIHILILKTWGPLRGPNCKLGWHRPRTVV